MKNHINVKCVVKVLCLKKTLRTHNEKFHKKQSPVKSRYEKECILMEVDGVLADKSNEKLLEEDTDMDTDTLFSDDQSQEEKQRQEFMKRSQLKDEQVEKKQQKWEEEEIEHIEKKKQEEMKRNNGVHIKQQEEVINKRNKLGLSCAKLMLRLTS